MNAPPRIAQGARQRIKEKTVEIQNSIAAIAAGRPGDAEPDPTRREQVYQARTNKSLDESRRLISGGGEGKERRFGATVDFVDVAFFERGMRAARAVARIITRDGYGFGTGFLISPRLLITNNHVIGSKAAAAGLYAEFDYERDAAGDPLRVTRFAFAPERCFLTNHEDDLDYTVIALGERASGEKDLSQFGYIPISGARNKHQLGDFVNIIQHPDGRMKEAVLRENQLVARAKTALHYLADTDPGASGSPVFNVHFALVALHHWGTPHREIHDENGNLIPKSVNEGIRASAICTDLTTLRKTLPVSAQDYVDEALRLGLERAPASTPHTAGREEANAPANQTFSPGVRIDQDGTATWSIPLTVSINLGGGTAQALQNVPRSTDNLQPTALSSESPAGREAKLELDPDYSKRDGYQPAFLEDVVVPLPVLSTAQKRNAAKNLQAKRGSDPYELKYYHYSVVMNGARRLAYYSAVNIDASQAKDFDREHGIVSDPYEDEGGQEASELWFEEDRILPEQQTPRNFYQRQTTYDAHGNEIVDKKTGNLHLGHMFQQGHLTRRQDPLWGDEELIPFANGDTFHVTNCAPQVGFFNMGLKKKASESGDREARSASAPKKKKHPGGQLHWRALEDYVLTNARAKREKVSVFTGPIFDDKSDLDWDRDREDMKGFKVPLAYWKLILRIEEEKLQATALLADQAPFIDYMPERLLRGEAATKPLPFEKVKQYHLSIKALEAKTGLDFTDVVRKADTYRPTGGGEERRMREVEEIDDVSLLRPRTRGVRDGSKRTRKRKPR